MRAFVHQLHDRRELLEVLLFAREEWIPLEVWKDLGRQVGNAARLVLDGPVRSIRTERAAREDPLEELQHLGAVAVLTDLEARPDFPAEPMTLAAVETHAEASLAICVPREIRPCIRVFVHLCTPESRRLVALMC